MGEESNLEKRLIFSGTVSVPEFEPIMVANPEVKWEHNVSEPIGKLKDIFTTDDVSFTCTVEPTDMKVFRKLCGLPEKPLSKVKRRRKSFKKALMAYGYSRDKAEIIYRFVALYDLSNSYAHLCKQIITLERGNERD